MAKPSRKKIEPLLEEWAKLKAAEARIEKAREVELKPIRERFQKQCAEIDSTANAKLAPIREKLAGLEAGISKQLLLGVGDDGAIALPQVATETAIAEVKSKDGSREIDPVKFFEQTPPAKRDSKFWGCVKILVAPAEKFLGDVINTIARKPRTHTVEVKQKS